jgi:MFS family permease
MKGIQSLPNKMNTQKKAELLDHTWLALAVSTLVMIGFYGTELSFGVFLKPILEEFQWTRTMVAGAMSAVIAISGPIGILTGRLSDKYGARTIVAVGTFFGVLGYVLMFRASSLWQLYVYFGLFLGIGISCSWVPLIATVSRLFTEKRVLAIGILTSGLTVGSMFVPPFTAYFITIYGWRISFLILALILLIACLPAIFILGNYPQGKTDKTKNDVSKNVTVANPADEQTQTKDWSASEAVKTLPFLMVITIGFVTAAGFFSIAVHIVAYATDMGIPTTSAALILSFQSIANITAKLTISSFTKKIGSRTTLAFLIALQALSLFLFMWATQLWMLYALGAIFGFGLGGSMTIRMSIVPEYFGTNAVGTLIGIAGVAWGLGGVVGPIFAGYIFDTTASYDVAFLTSSLLLLVGMIAALFLKAPKSFPHM